MIWTSNAEKLLAILRGSKPFVYLDKVTLSYKGVEFDGLGTMEVDSEHSRFEIDFRFQDEAVPIEFLELFRRQTGPSMENPEDCWKAEATTASGIRFSMRVQPPHNSKWSASRTLRFWSHVEAINVVPDPWDTGDRDVQLAQSDRITAILIKREKPYAEAAAEGDKLVELVSSKSAPKFHAILAGVKLDVTNSAVVGTHHHPVEGKIPKFDSGLYMEDHEDYVFYLQSYADDLHVVMVIKNPDATRDDCQKKFQALLSAVAFTHGYHSWPLLEEHCLEGRILLCRIRPYLKLERAEFQPLNEHLSRTYRDCGTMIGAATRFFSSGVPLTRVFLDFAFLHRDAGMKAVPLKVQALTVCTIFEGLMIELLKEHRLEENALLSDDGRAFNAAKNEALAWSRAQGAGEEATITPWARISSRLENSSYLRTKEKVKTVGDHYGLPWDGDLKLAYSIWDQVRHALAHGASGEMNFNRSCNFFTAWSHLSGAIFRFMLAEMGYTGWFRYSPMEVGKENMRVIPESVTSVETVMMDENSNL